MRSHQQGLGEGDVWLLNNMHIAAVHCNERTCLLQHRAQPLVLVDWAVAMSCETLFSSTALKLTRHIGIAQPIAFEWSGCRHAQRRVHPRTSLSCFA